MNRTISKEDHIIRNPSSNKTITERNKTDLLHMKNRSRF